MACTLSLIRPRAVLKSWEITNRIMLAPKITPRWNPPPGEGALGIKVSVTNSKIIEESLPLWRAFPEGVRSCFEILVLFRNEILSWFIQWKAPQVLGPVGIAQLTSEVARTGISPLLNIIALISLNLAIINLFPFPALDGGRILFLLIEYLRRGKRMSPQREGLVNLIGFIVLIALILVVSYLDIIRIIQGKELLP